MYRTGLLSRGFHPSKMRYSKNALSPGNEGNLRLQQEVLPRMKVVLNKKARLIQMETSREALLG